MQISDTLSISKLSETRQKVVFHIVSTTSTNGGVYIDGVGGYAPDASLVINGPQAASQIEVTKIKWTAVHEDGTNKQIALSWLDSGDSPIGKGFLSLVGLQGELNLNLDSGGFNARIANFDVDKRPLIQIWHPAGTGYMPNKWSIIIELRKIGFSA